MALLSHNGGSQIVLAWKNTHAPEQNSFDCWWLQDTHGCRKIDFLVGRPKLLKYTPVALGSRQFEDTLPQQQLTHFFPWLYSCVRLALTLKETELPLQKVYADAVMWVTLPVIFVMEEVGGGSDVFVKVFVKGHALIHSGKWEGHVFFRKKFLKYPDPPRPTPPPPIKNVPSLMIMCLCACNRRKKKYSLKSGFETNHESLLRS